MKNIPYFLIALMIASCIMTEFMKPLSGVIAFLTLSILYFLGQKFLFNQKPDMKIKEKWGEYLPSQSGESFGIARTYFPSDSRKREDSREILEELGFTILGIADQVLYRVEPPLGWTQKKESHLHIYIR
jgi:hypothetical protein